jgi:hypothetical protein
MDEVSHLGDECALLRSPSHGDPVTTAKLEETLVTEEMKGAEHGVFVHAQHRSEVFCERQPVAGSSLTLCDRTPDLGRHLFGERQRIAAVDVQLHDPYRTRTNQARQEVVQVRDYPAVGGTCQAI